MRDRCREPRFCRDCLADAGAAQRALRRLRLAAAAAPRRARALAIAHVDCDAFYATIEKRDDPSLATEPRHRRRRQARRGRDRLLHRPHLRREFGDADVRGAAALPACRCGAARHGEICRASGREVRQMMLALTPLVEPLSIDEAFLDLSGTERLHGMPAAPRRWRASPRAVEQRARHHRLDRARYNKFLAKIASDLDKPRGFAVLGARRSARRSSRRGR